MPILSKYSDEQVESLMQQIQTLFDQNEAPADLRLMVLGNLTTHHINRLPQAQRMEIAQSFSAALTNSVKSSGH
ncbi:YejL family protein [Dongshaea marina]|uniref:DUF1414 domain-containing protein n=1 Tax=Dongshaea marina TaxID=2047966 RepID=UPI000D3E55AF|nr:DUF1414 domain-containing protein [Dongshaea marina]